MSARCESALGGETTALNYKNISKLFNTTDQTSLLFYFKTRIKSAKNPANTEQDFNDKFNKFS